MKFRINTIVIFSIHVHVTRYITRVAQGVVRQFVHQVNKIFFAQIGVNLADERGEREVKCALGQYFELYTVLNVRRTPL